MLRIDDSNKTSTKAILVVLTTIAVVYSIVIRNTIRNNLKKIIRNRELSLLRVVILIVIDVLDFNNAIRVISTKT